MMGRIFGVLTGKVKPFRGPLLGNSLFQREKAEAYRDQVLRSDHWRFTVDTTARRFQPPTLTCRLRRLGEPPPQRP